MDTVHRRRVVRRPRETDRELLGDTANILALPAGADAALEAGIAMDANGGQVVQGDRQLTVEKRPEARGEFLLHAFGIFLDFTTARAC